MASSLARSKRIVEETSVCGPQQRARLLRGHGAVMEDAPESGLSISRRKTRSGRDLRRK